jgi:hypothetical protein
MSQGETILIVVTVTICSTLGVYVAVRVINQWTTPTVNTLVRRSGDIELVDYIEPNQPVVDFIEPIQPALPNPTYHSDILGRDYRLIESIHEYPGYVPSSIICPLENTINIDFILWLIVIILQIIIIIILIRIFNYFY